MEGKALGAQMHFAALALSAALAMDRPLLLEDGSWAYGQHAACKARGRRCYFTPLLLSCDASKLLARLAAESTHQGGVDPELLDSARHVRAGLLPQKTQQSSTGSSPGNGEEPGSGGLGDSCLHSAMSASRPLCLPLAHYFEGVAEMVHRYDPVAVFLATDDPEVVEEMREAVGKMRHPGSPAPPRFLAQDFDRSIFSSNLFVEHAFEGEVDQGEVAERTLLVRMLLR
ncbi:hypothetical protein T484DRAFT_1907079 [Baffinella frigidus]|nr:hypothetical protein T484DRAFT_1907079 [Cryptophyta sp. CCMP2293]